ncbi:MAG: hypothetical protein C0514_05855 [Candidatus Puniceispirillum sp.]|nr:hypothetical protein [Candidatus Puniceispirillum sp.]
MLSVDVTLSLAQVIKRDMEVVTNNIANAQTAGYKGFATVLSESRWHPTPKQDYSFVQDLATVRDTSLGAFKQTGDPFHLYINGQGYFAVQTPQGTRYTRSGVFTLDNLNQIVTAQGYPVMDTSNSPIVLPEGVFNISIGKDGTITDGEDNIGTVGRFSIPAGANLTDEAGSLINTDMPAVLDEEIPVLQHGYEASNVNTVVETTKLMSLLRAYQQAQSYIEAQSKLQSQMAQQLIKIAPAA